MGLLIKPFELASIIMETDKETLEEIFNTKIESNEDIFKRFDYEKALLLYCKYKGQI